MKSNLHKVSEDVKNLFQFVACYKPREVEIEAILKPFIPDYIPAVGAVDEFIKVPRPDGIPDYLGLKVLDESGPVQTDPAVVALQLRASSMQSSHHLAEVPTVEEPERNPRKIEAWIESMREFHRSKPPSSVTYSKPMPDMEKLVSECPTEIEKVLAETQLTNTQDVDLPTFVDICCSLFGIPVYKSRVESLHCLFALFLELKAGTGL
ncbi:hypothetical protein GOP47_0027475 [Adiantum capillus-veneris]|nr:hypothetical protein GOP47_0027475 [Adiantum capillus-veneris]